MIRRLRRKFILINMSLVTAVLLIVFSAVCYSSFQRQRQESLDAMRMALGRDLDAPPPKALIGGHPRPGRKTPLVPVFCVTLAADGSLAVSQSENVSIDAAVLNSAVEQAAAQSRESGVLPQLGLRYLRQSSPEGMKIAFADLSGERSAMTGLLVTSLLVGLGALGAFLAVSVFLARWALHPVAAAWERQRQFVADASHELKTPLTVILANTDILLSHPSDPIAAQQRWVRNTKEEAVRMRKLVDDLLFLAKSDAARAPAAHLLFSLSDTVQGCLLQFEPVAFERGITLEGETDPGVELVGDEGQLRQLVMILLDNACKYSPAGETVTASLRRTGERALLEVRNTGAPVAPEDLEHLFERFYRADKSRAREEGGYGLGLAIARSIAQSHRGTIRVKSENGVTTFTVSLPLRKIAFPCREQ